jgi:hypothetical protein
MSSTAQVKRMPQIPAGYTGFYEPDGSKGPLPHIIQTSNVPIHLYAYEIEDAALEQIKLLASTPVCVDYIAVMPGK